MERHKVRVGITHGDINGIGYEVIFKAFAEPGMLDVCTPVIYGSPKAAAYHRKAIDSQVAFTTVASAEDIAEGRLNMVECYPEEVQGRPDRRCCHSSDQQEEHPKRRLPLSRTHGIL